MVKRSGELREDISVLKNGHGLITCINFLEEADAMKAGRGFVKCIIPPGCSIGYHQHVGDFETYYILSGVADINDNGREDVLHPGDVLVCKDGDWHSIANNGTEDVVYIAIILYNHEK